MSKRSCCHIPMKQYPKNDYYFVFFFLGKLANVLLRNFYYNALGAFFDALIQRTDGCTEFLWLLVQLTTSFAVHINIAKIAISTSKCYFDTV